MHSRRNDKLFEATIYETLFVLEHQFSLWHVSQLIGKLHALKLNLVQKSTVRAIIRKVKRRLEIINSDLDKVN